MEWANDTPAAPARYDARADGGSPDAPGRRAPVPGVRGHRLALRGPPAGLGRRAALPGDGAEPLAGTGSRAARQLRAPGLPGLHPGAAPAPLRRPAERRPALPGPFTRVAPAAGAALRARRPPCLPDRDGGARRLAGVRGALPVAPGDRLGAGGLVRLAGRGGAAGLF